MYAHNTDSLLFQRPFNRHFMKTLLKQRCSSFRDASEGKDKDRKSRHRNESAFVAFDDIMADIAKNISTHCIVQPSTNDANNSEQNQEKSIPTQSTPIDPKQFALNSETFAKAGEVLSNLAQHFVSVMDPFAVHEFIPNTQTNANGPKNETKKADEPQTVVQENEDKGLNAVPVAESTKPKETSPIVAAAASIPVNSPKEQVTIEDVIDQPSAPRDSSPTADWFVVDANGHIEDQPKTTGAIPKTSAVETPISVGSVDAAQALPNYAILARDLEDHLHLTLKSQASQTPPQMPIIHHPSK